MSKLRKALLTLAATAALAGAFAAPAAAAPAQGATSVAPAAVTQCRVEFVSLTGTNMWHDGGRDWIWFVIDGTYFPGNFNSIPFFGGTTQTAGTFNSPTRQFSSGGSVTFQVVLDRTWPTANRVIDSNTVSCATTGSNLPLRFTDGDATYDLLYNALFV
ncbi:MAG: hypothetical protein AUI14_06190 [Actinobacteria bacterium 13_2_20CM_2_71_6]|nr:MAG: hypothetical protein AUI14_06190 [Actinobacteria bacterium 13_2_20CM_2_71_6]